MREQIKQAIKVLVKKLIPEIKIAEAILKAEKLKGEGFKGAQRLEEAVNSFFMVKLPVPLNLLAIFAKDLLKEAITEAVQEEFDLIKQKLEEEGVTFL